MVPSRDREGAVRPLAYARGSETAYQSRLVTPLNFKRHFFQLFAGLAGNRLRLA